ncbi:MAG: transglycosylase SLT domain-containing protein, partial [Candidatus Eremiobacterota bacterium]
VSGAGAAGLCQLMPDTAVRHGLSLSPIDERLVPSKALPVGVAVLAEKHDVIMHPEDYYPTLGEKINQAYRQYGLPSGDQLWHLDLAAYNGGGGTVLRAMGKAFDRGQDPRDWSTLMGADKPRESPLYLAVKEVYGSGVAWRKYREMAAYPRRILALRDRT